jgi:hypothetical protein
VRNWAEGTAYGKQRCARRPQVLRCGHRLDRCHVRDLGIVAPARGNTVAVHFTNLADGIAVYEADRPIGFQICNAAKRCSYASATLSRDEIDLDVSLMPDVATVRFCWGDSPMCNIYNSAGLPAVPFEMAVTPAEQPAPVRMEKRAIRRPRKSR